MKQLEVRREPEHDFLARRAEGRTVFVGNEVIDSQVTSPRFQPARDRANVFITLLWLNSTKKGVLEKPIELKRGRIGQKVGEAKLSS